MVHDADTGVRSMSGHLQLGAKTKTSQRWGTMEVAILFHGFIIFLFLLLTFIGDVKRNKRTFYTLYSVISRVCLQSKVANFNL